ncbi:MAG: ABC transporter ATP-binding protein [Firmicutes bacterium]|nr:ABC transporter ATP-binding protein [Bacillota bacterium]
MLAVKDLEITFSEKNSIFKAVRKVSFSVQAGEILGIVGESGSGKSMTALALTGLLPPEAKVCGSMSFAGKTMHFEDNSQWQGLRGSKIGIVFQDPAACLNPLKTVGKQVAEPLILHKGLTPKEAEVETIRLFSALGIEPAVQRIHHYPHQLSGGQQQRVMLAAAIACKPMLLIADEPTTALDVTVQAQILRLLHEYVHNHSAALLLISHDLGVIAQLADEVLVMCGGTIVEKGSVYQIMQKPLHPYTKLLLASLPRLDAPLKLPLVANEGLTAEGGCVFAARCPHYRAICLEKEPPTKLLAEGRQTACHIL